MLIWENMKLALTAIKVNKMRSFLTMLGIIIGVGSVISIVSIGDTMRSVIADEYASIGLGRVIVYVGYVEDQRDTDLFTLDELEKVQEAFSDRIEAIDTMSGENTTLTKGRNNLKAQLQGVPGNYSEVQPVDIIYGRMLNQHDLDTKKPYVVLENQTAVKLFGKANATGETVRTTIRGEVEDLMVVGIYQKTTSLLNRLFSDDIYEVAYVPYSLLTYPEDKFFGLNIYMAEGVNIELLKKQMTGLVSRMKNRETKDIIFYSAQEEMTMLDQVMQGLSGAVGAIAAISLLVGGIGIMNIMLVSVTERTKEIGIRKALGARTRDIMIQFLTESALLSAAGGIIGILFGVGIVALGGVLLGIGVTVNPVAVLVAVGFSAAVGLFFGIYPASRAAKSDPILALRYE